MSGDDNLDERRRTILKSLGSAGVAGVGAAALSSGVAAESDGIDKTRLDLDGGDTLSALSALGVVGDRTEFSLPENVLAGEQLLKTLREEGHLRASSLEDVVARARDAFRTEGALGPEVHFRISTGDGYLQITFDSDGDPFAAYFPDDRPESILYVLDDDTEDSYKQLVHEPAVSLDCGSNCGGCTCESFCRTQPWNNRRYCQACDDGDCIVQRNCRC